MLSIQQATDVLRKGIPVTSVEAVITYGDLYIFRVIRDEPGEEEMDPFFSINRETGELRDFSIITDGNAEITALFMKAKKPES